MDTMTPKPAARAAPTAPLVKRSPMRARPWFGLLRGLAVALLPGLRFGSPKPRADWAAAAGRRRRVLLTLVASSGAAAAALMASSAPPEPGALWWAHAALAVLLAAWLAAGLATALMGAWMLRRGDPHALALREPNAPVSRQARTAVIMPICNEDIATVFAGLSATAESVAATGALALFDFYVLSDSNRPELRAAELRAWQQLRQTLGDGALPEGARVFYRWRRHRTRKKAGNVADFCRRWGANYRYMVVLDADSTMSGDTLVQLVRLMEAHPQAGIVQTLPQAAGAITLHARMQQFASRVTGRLFALGMTYWQLGESHYWGHNAILRVQPFMQHCALAKLPGRGGLSGEILSHDFVEAALMRRAGYEVWLAPELSGSWEQHPPHLIDELQRDRRWCQGNLQNARLIAEPGLAPAHRTMLAVGAFSYAVAPLWLLFVVLGLLSGGAQIEPSQLGLWGLTLLLLLLPRALGVLAVCWARQQAQFGGAPRLVAGALLELVLSSLQAPVRLVAHSVFVVSALLGVKMGWKSPLRDAAAVRISEALRGVGTLVAPPLAAAALLALLTTLGAAQVLPFVLPLLLVVPLVWATAHPRLGAMLLRRRWLGVPEEQAPPRALRRSSEPGAYRFFEAPAVAAARAPRRAWGWYHVVGWALGLVVLATGLAPQSAQTPGFPAAWRAEAERILWLRQLAVAPLPVPEVELRREAPPRPARMIDNGVRQRALQAVQSQASNTPLPAPAVLKQAPAESTPWLLPENLRGVI